MHHIHGPWGRGGAKGLAKGSPGPRPPDILSLSHCRLVGRVRGNSFLLAGNIPRNLVLPGFFLVAYLGSKNTED